MNKNTIIILIVLAVIFVLWTLWGFLGSRVEQAEYTVVRKNKNYEVRTYPSHIVAQATVPGDYTGVMNSGFSIVAGYIFGDNTKKEKIAMTAPVVEKSGISEKIAMTAPVVISGDKLNRIISFSMPKGYTLETLPVPNDKRVQIVEIPEKNFAVARFYGYRNSSMIEKATKELKEKLIEDKIEIVGSPSYAGYNAPGTPPWMTRNEVLIEIK
jgi:effector-binding domain-containing protein